MPRLCFVTPIFTPHSADPAYSIATHFADYHESSLFLGFDDDTTEHLARMTNEAADTTLIDPLVILERSENYLNDWSR
jgi:hypothetical protein